MTEPKERHRSRRSNAEYRWTRPKIFAFLRVLSTTGSVAQAARSVGMSRQSAYRLRVRMGDSFGEVWDEALALAHARWAGLTGRHKVTVISQDTVNSVHFVTLRSGGPA